MMRDRLIELLRDTSNYTKGVCIDFEEAVEINADHLLANGVIVVDTAAVSVENRPLISQRLGRPLDEIIELVQAKEDGRIIVPPCKVGDTVYRLKKRRGIWEVLPREVVSITHRLDHLYRLVWEIFTTEQDRLGKTVFLTREQAERALAERSAE